MGDYWIDRKELANEDIESIVKSPFWSSIEGQTQITATDSDSNIYNMGDQMKSYLSVG